jgi:hypothetical protein
VFARAESIYQREKHMRLWRCGLIMLVPALLIACSRGPVSGALPPQQWGNVSVAVEISPAPPAAGMNEFLVIATDASGRPAWNMVVSLRAGTEDDWHQAIQDGESGVYRKAIALRPGPQTLYVELKRAGEETVLEYALEVH